jgi:hypothetical protein
MFNLKTIQRRTFFNLYCNYENLFIFTANHYSLQYHRIRRTGPLMLWITRLKKKEHDP